MHRLLTLAFVAALSIMTSSCLAADYTQPGKLQALHFNLEHDGNSDILGLLLPRFGFEYFGERQADEATLVENRSYAMGAFLLELIAPPASKNPRVATCLKRAFNNSFVCKKPTHSH